MSVNETYVPGFVPGLGSGAGASAPLAGTNPTGWVAQIKAWLASEVWNVGFVLIGILFVYGAVTSIGDSVPSVPQASVASGAEILAA